MGELDERVEGYWTRNANFPLAFIVIRTEGRIHAPVSRQHEDLKTTAS